MEDSCSCVDESVESNPSCPKSCKDLDAKNPKFELPSLGPLTPDTTKENGNFPFNLNSPPTLPKLLISESNTNDIPASPKTPKDGVFDPFAPGPNEMAMAPHCKKYLDEARASVSRCLNFTSSFRRCSFDADSFTDEEMFETVYENLLEAIVFKQTEGALTQVPNEECDSDACRTPPLAPRLNGLAETCPGAPLKSTVKSRVIDLGLCRKLEF
ncbi:hypothetical protein K2173_008146 [Erythroxylum novogranatense]|uniref:Uncharacterized protein n=1 Tax=Erythroxylum novogranatense TaxID=1862640 RepID=A0AAV8UC63_9ROSI|nr:hypothetical protein K2173_008146 [Erythroxylum novogranatense]